MAFKAQTQPFCRCCGKPISKWTTTVYCGHSIEHSSQFSRQIKPKPSSKDECQTLTNEKVLTIAWHKREGKNEHIWKFTTWDGESYKDEFFCTGTCAQRLGYAAARKGLVTSAYRERS